MPAIFNLPRELTRLLQENKGRNAARILPGLLFALAMPVVGSHALAQQSDEFNETSLNPAVWQVQAPAGGSATVSNGELIITVPGGSNHDAFVPALDAVQVVQSISNQNFDVAVKIDSKLQASVKYYGQGLLVEGDAKNYIRYEVSAGGSVSLSANTIINGTQTSKVKLSPFSSYVVPTYLRLQRVGTTYTAYWSTDGVNWNVTGSFNDSLVVTGLAPYAWNYSSTPSQATALTASFDWFHNQTVSNPSPAATPTFTPVSGTSFSSTLSVSIADSTPASTIYYTTDGSTPTTSSQVYSVPFSINASTTVNAIATAGGFTQSAQGSASYVFSPVTVAATPTFNPVSGTSFSSTLSVSIADTTPNATIYYTTDGSAPTTTSQVYSNPFTISASTTVNAIATASGLTQSAQGSASYTLVPVQQAAATPTFTPVSGTTFSSTLSVSIADTTPGATIYYTTNGSAPTTGSQVYSVPFTISSSTTVNAIATASGFTQSAQGSASYSFVPVTGGAPASDEFNQSSLNTALWQVRAPAGGSATVNNGELVITVPGGSNHDAFVPALDAVQVVQTISNGNFDVAVKIDSTLQAATKYYGQGLMVEGDAKNYIRYEVSAGGSISLSANTIIAGTQTSKLKLNPFSGYAVPTYLRLQRAGNTYAAYWSADGVNWNVAGTFTDSLVVTGLALYASNYNSTPSQAPALTASFDWFHNQTVSNPSPAATPTFTPVSGTSFSSTLSVSIADSTPGPTIYYTTDGSSPTTSSQVYSTPFTISASTTVNAIATASGFTQSAQGSASYSYVPITSSVVSDNFDSPTLNSSLWAIENPLGDGTVTMNGSAVTLNVPGCETPAEAPCPNGTSHDATSTGNNTVRIMQSIGNTDFSVDVRFQSAVEIGNQDEGILVEQDGADFLRFDVLYSGTTGPKLFAEGISGGNATTFISTPIALPKGPLVLRLARAGNVWTGSWSTDGITFAAAPNFTFDLNVARVGPYAGSSGAQPPLTAIVDYFFNTADPISNHDGPLPYGYVTIDANPAGTTVEKALADIEGTGHLEPVVGLELPSAKGNGTTNGIYWYQYPASGKVNDPWIKHTIVASGDAYEDMLPYDVNNDGAVDIVASFSPLANGANEIVWFENPRGSGGNPATDPWTMHVVGPGIAENALALQDIDGDGKIDIVTPSSIFFQDSPTSWTQLQYSTSGRGVAPLDIGSGNGAINLAGTQNASPYNMAWWENPRESGGNARTGKWILHIIGPGYPCSANNCGDGGEVTVFQTTDVNGDGKMDVISAQSEGPGGGIAPPPGGVIWWEAPVDRRNGTWIKHTIDANVIDVHKIGLGDMDKNGTLDIIVAEQDQSPLNRVIVYYNDGKGNLTPQVISNAKGHNAAIGSVKGNPGELDILNSGHGYFNDSHPLQIFFNPY